MCYQHIVQSVKAVYNPDTLLINDGLRNATNSGCEASW